ncbi:MAG TPA: MBL fold metallo-hydrolase [Terriglobales bacterium]|jgi:ribonuclease BN (tRNA processing enzyme)|nr:MBL fold metallo-hydrolase [Terriglobales bacterium]
MVRNVLFVISTLIVVPVNAQSSAAPGTHTQVVMLGVGNPNADPERSGPAVAIVVNGAAYLVDCGPGVVRRAAAAEKNGIAALKVTNLKTVFITHLHSDHTLGYPDLIFTPWVLNRTEPLTAYGPRGLRSMTAHIEKAWRKDIQVRTRGLEQANRTGYKVVVHEISPGVVYRDANVTVTAFAVKHGTWDQAFGFRFDTADRSVVISGDTAPVESVVQACNGCDVLLHEVYNPHGDELKEEHWKEYFRTFHTSPEELGDIARRARPKLLVLYHLSLERLPESDLVEQVKKAYSGEFVSAKDLWVY